MIIVVMMIMIVITIINVCSPHSQDQALPTLASPLGVIIFKIVIMMMILTIFVGTAKELNDMICKDLYKLQ